MEQEKDKDKVPYSWYIGIVGLAVLTVGIYLGWTIIEEDNSSSWPLIFTAIFVVASLLLIILAMYAKRQDEHQTRWKVVGYACIAVYLAVAVFFAKPFCKFVYVSRTIGDKTTLQEMAEKDVAAISQVYDDYEKQRNTALTEANKRLSDYANSHPYENTVFYQDVNTLCGNEGVDDARVAKWYIKTDSLTKVDKDYELESLSTRISDWDYSELSSISSDLQSKVYGLESAFSKKISESPTIPIIELKPYRHDGDYVFNLTYPMQSEFAEALFKDKYSALGLVAYVFFHICILLCWAVAKGTNMMETGDMSHVIGGIPLTKKEFFK